MEGCEAWYGKMGRRGVLAGRAGRNGVGRGKAEVPCIEKQKIMTGRYWPADAGSELAGCRGMFGVTVLPAGLTEKQNVVLRCSPGCKPGWGVCGARSPAYFRCVLLPAAYSFVFRRFSRNPQKNRFIFSFLHITCIEQRGDMRASGPPEI